MVKNTINDMPDLYGENTNRIRYIFEHIFKNLLGIT